MLITTTQDVDAALTFAKFSQHPDDTIEMEGVELNLDKAEEELRLFKGLTQTLPHGTSNIKAKDSSAPEEVMRSTAMREHEKAAGLRKMSTKPPRVRPIADT